MESVDAKIARAKEHLHVFDRDAKSYMEKARPRFIRKTNLAQTEHWLSFYVEDPFPPIELSAIVGDCLYNLRSALDCLVCGLVRTRNHSSSCAGRQFPIFTESAEYLAARRSYLRGVPKPARTLIDGLQPWCRPEGTRHLDPLWILNELCRRDKHRAALLTLCYHKDVELLMPLKNGTTLLVKLAQDIYAGNPDTIGLPGSPDSMDDNVNMKIAGRSVLTFRDEGPWGDRSVDEILITCLQYVEDRVVPRFKPFFG